MLEKLAKYGIKNMCLCNAWNSYILNAYAYSRKDSDGDGLTEDEKKFNKPTQAVLRFFELIKKSNRNITANNWISSVELIQCLKEKGLRYVRTLRKDKKETPKEFQVNKSRELGSSLYGFTK